MSKTISVMLAIALVFILTACSQASEPDISQDSPKQGDTSAYSEANATDEQNSTAPSGTPETDTAAAGKVLVAYFSCTGNTEKVAGYIAGAISADLYEIAPEEAYTAEDLDYSNLKARAIVEQSDDSLRPVISGTVENMDDYDIVFLGYPIWCGKAPKIISTFLEEYDFSNKTLIPFCTSGSSGITSTVAELQSLCPDTVTWLSGMRFSGSADETEVTNWISSLELW